MAPAELDGDPVDVEMDGIVETAEGRTALGTEVKDGGGGKRTRAEEDGGAAGGSEARNGGPAPASKKRKPQTTTHLTANSPTLLLVCNVEIDILRSILSRLRSRFDYLFLGFTCKQLYNTIIQTQMHCQWFTQYMNEGWFSTFDAETEVKKVHPIRRMTVDDASVVRCNFRNVETVSDFCKMDTFDGGNCSFEWVASLVADDAEDCLDRLKVCPPPTLELMCRVICDGSRFDSHDALSEFFEWQREGSDFYFDVTMKTRSKLFRVRDRLKVSSRADCECGWWPWLHVAVCG